MIAAHIIVSRLGLPKVEQRSEPQSFVRLRQRSRDGYEGEAKICLYFHYGYPPSRSEPALAVGYAERASGDILNYSRPPVAGDLLSIHLLLVLF